MMVMVAIDEFGHYGLAACRELNRSGNAGAYFSVLCHASEYGSSLETVGLEWERVTPRSSRRVATGLLVIDVPGRRAPSRAGAGCRSGARPGNGRRRRTTRRPSPSTPVR